MERKFKYFGNLIIFGIVIFFSIGFTKPKKIDTDNTVFLRNDGKEVVLKVKIMQIAKKGSPIICDVEGSKLYAISDAGGMCIGSGIINKDGILEIIYNNPFRERGKDWIYIERLYFVMQKGGETIGYGAPDPSHPCFTGQYNYDSQPAVIDRKKAINPDKLAISFVLPHCYSNTDVNPVPDGIPWNLVGPQKKSSVEDFAKAYGVKKCDVP
ncbi:hypothetical protein A2Y83_03355 [Candidatus Falkowbacteria bacterium RBG_13_39_14]|uniref:Uncharacterized protein n=1 Tax=Candidatus Falkowbacteria bacterium RBG_13_39_14 TaxID=1797985 RepID=A0A1F5S5P1_9BACT|nr:MAG: hypothetical protein A2Y83_03355 [Candidatus Falkowbacteria bacterium RBG_13_39_14]